MEALRNKVPFPESHEESEAQLNIIFKADISCSMLYPLECTTSLLSQLFIFALTAVVINTS